MIFKDEIATIKLDLTSISNTLKNLSTKSQSLKNPNSVQFQLQILQKLVVCILFIQFRASYTVVCILVWIQPLSRF